jgi:hypothetical protein
VLLVQFGQFCRGRSHRLQPPQPQPLWEARDPLYREADVDLVYARSDGRRDMFNLSYHQIIGLEAQLSDANASGTSDTIVNYFRGTLRLIIVGPAGAGKTVLLRQLQQGLLTDDQEPLAVYLQLPTWNPESLDLEAWATRQLLDVMSPDLLRKRRNQSSVIVLLDGLDEMDPDDTGAQAASEAVRRLADFPYPFAVACREVRLRELQLLGAHLPNSTTIQLHPLEPDELCQHLRGALPDGPSRAALVEGIQQQTLPMLMSVLRDEAAVSSLLAAESSTRHDVEVLLLRRYVNLAVRRPKRAEQARAGNGKMRRSNAELRRANKRYPADLVERWLRTLAVYVTEKSGREIHGVELPSGLIVPHHLSALIGETRARAASIILTVLLWIPILVLLGGRTLATEKSRWIEFVILAVAVLLLAGSVLMTGGAVRPIRIVVSRLRQRPALKRFSVSLALAAALVIVGSRFADGVFALLFASGFFVAFGFGLVLAVRPDIRLSAIALVGGLVACILGPLARAVTLNSKPTVWVVAGAVAGALSLVAAWLVGSKVPRAEDAPQIPSGYVTGPSPYLRLNSDIASATVIFGIAAALTFLGAWQTPPLNASTEQAALLAVAAGLAAGPGLVSVAWRRYVVARALSGNRLPLRLRAFMDWSCRAGLLRRAGAAYQFRHDRLRAYLYDGS